MRKVGNFYPIVITSGDYVGLNAYVQKYEVSCNVSRPGQHARISRGVEHQFIPLFQFGVFYQNDLEMLPGPSMTFAGRVHSNGDIYVGAGTDLYFNSFVTAVGQIWHRRKDGTAVSTGPVYFKDYWGANQNMNRSGYWLDSSRPTWQTEAISRWGGMVRDSSMSVQPLVLPLPQAGQNQIEIIQRGLFSDPPELRNARYYWKATIRVLDGVAYDTMGQVINMGAGTLGTGSFYDQREQRTMHTTEFNVSAMITNHTVPTNGIIYISGSNMGDAVRIINAGTLPTGGLTIASDNPIYVKGNYNNTAKKSSSIIGDAVTCLSANWLDSRSTQPYTNRVACETTVNSSIMTGNRETILNGGYSGNYNGGLENVIRFLEKWDNIWFHYRGSINDLWYSAQATGAWQTGVYYSAPKRDWGFDADLLAPSNWPPGSPRLHTVQRGAWRQIS
jgi:hypothetical protein